MAVTWAARRQILYYGVAIIFASLVGYFAWQTFFTHAPSCTDKVQNGKETGIDCGGTCALLCANIARPPVILWSRAFLSSPHIYTAVAYIQNNNSGAFAGAKSVHYSFQLLDSNNLLIAEREGVADLPPIQTIPIVEVGIDAGTRVVAKTFFTFDTKTSVVWKKVPEGSIQKLRIGNTTPYENGRFSATITNDGFDDAKKVTVVGVLFDSAGVARAASKSVVARVAHQSSETVTFTWPNIFPNIARGEVTVIPSF